MVVQSLSHVQLFVTPWTAARQVSLSSTISWSLLMFMSIEFVMLSNHLIHLILCHPQTNWFFFFGYTFFGVFGMWALHCNVQVSLIVLHRLS